jgi:hypothetical protein
MQTQKPTGGWKSNSYVMFDYWSPTDFKFAGIDISINKMVIGHRTPAGWIVDAQGAVQGSLRYDAYYGVLLTVNGTVVTVSIDGSNALSYTFGPRVVDGVSYGLNKGLVGFGSDNSRGVLDNLAVQAVAPPFTLDSTEYFEGNAAERFTPAKSGIWTLGGGRYTGAPAGSIVAVSTVDLGSSVASTSSVEVEATVSSTGIGGLAFDAYAIDDFKFVALDIAGGRVLVGHVSRRGGWVVDAAFAQALNAGIDYVLNLALKGTVVTVTLNGNVLGSTAYNGGVADGQVGAMSKTGTTTLDRIRIRTDDPAFAGSVQPPELRIGDASVTEGNSGTTTVTLTLTLTSPVASATSVGWRTVNGTALAGPTLPA